MAIRSDPVIAARKRPSGRAFSCVHWGPMDNERIREICLSFPHARETLNWGHHLVYWAGDRELGGRMFAMTDIDGTGRAVLWFHCGAERFYELLEIEGIFAAPHLARAHWVAVERWDVLRPRQIEDELRQAHQLIFEKLSKRTKAVLTLPEKDRARLIRERMAQARNTQPAKKKLAEPGRPRLRKHP